MYGLEFDLRASGIFGFIRKHPDENKIQICGNVEFVETDTEANNTLNIF